jgi:hypothetical protein
LSTFDTVGTETSAAAAITAIVTRCGDPAMVLLPAAWRHVELSGVA